MKVIASSLRKGNIVDLDGKLYVVLNAENFHPGKGTPTTQVDMRRISDGVKTQGRYKTTDQVYVPMSKTTNSATSIRMAKLGFDFMEPGRLSTRCKCLPTWSGITRNISRRAWW